MGIRVGMGTPRTGALSAASQSATGVTVQPEGGDDPTRETPMPSQLFKWYKVSLDAILQEGKPLPTT